MLIRFLLRNLVLVVDFPVSALIRLPVGRHGCLEPLPGQIQQSLVFRESHTQDFNSILFDLFLCGFVVGVYLFDEGF